MAGSTGFASKAYAQLYAGSSRLPQITAPNEFQGTVIGDVNRRKGIIMGSEQEGDDVIINVSPS